MVKSVFCFIFTLFLILSPFSVLASDGPLTLSAESAVLINAEDGNIIFEKNSSKKLPMASTTKIMTCLLALENAELSDIVKIANEAIGVEGSSLYLAKGDCASLLDLLYAVMLRSANDAASAVAYHVGGGIEEFSQMMNEKAEALGLTGTHFTNPHGLHDENHYTTASDLAKLAAYALKNETFAKIVSSKEYTVSLNGGELKKPIVNHNKLLRIYEGASGVKTGFTKTSGRCLVSSALRDGVSLVAVTLNAPSDWKDHAAMLDYGFSKYENVTVMEKDSFTKSFKVFGQGTVDATNSEALSLSVEKGSEITIKAEGQHLLFPPVHKGDAIAEAVVYLNGKEVARRPLFAMRDVIPEEEKTYIQKLFERSK